MDIKRILLYLGIFLMFVFSPIEVKAEGEGTTQRKELYPINVEEITDDNGFMEIVKTYALNPSENPADIPKSSFEKYGEVFVFSDIVKNEKSSNNTINHVETITINTDTNNSETILAQLAQEMQYSKDGYEGTLYLNLHSIKTSPAGYKTSSSTLKATREYTNLANNDSSSIPKSISQGGLTYSLVNVQFSADRSTMIDYEEIPDTYRATAYYQTTGTSKNVTGYITTAEYGGDLSKTLIDTIIYKVYFLSENLITDMSFNKHVIDMSEFSDNPLDESLDTDLTEEQTTSKKDSDGEDDFMIRIIIIVLTLAVTGIICLFVGYQLSSKQSAVIVYNQNDDDTFRKIAKVKIKPKNNNILINLNQFRKSITSEIFILELSKKLIKNLLKTEKDFAYLTVKYRRQEIKKKIDLTDEYDIDNEIYIDFSEKKKKKPKVRFPENVIPQKNVVFEDEIPSDDETDFEEDNTQEDIREDRNLEDFISEDDYFDITEDIFRDLGDNPDYIL